MSFEEAYYETSRFWEGSALTDPLNTERYELTGRILPHDVETLLDVGCGNGMFGRYLTTARPEIRVVSMDRSQEALRHVTTEKLEGDVARIPAEDRSYDCVTCLEVIEHLPVTVYGTALQELTRVSRRHVVISVPYRERTDRDTTTCPQCLTTFNAHLHLRRFDDEALGTLLDDFGFRRVEHSFPPPTRVALGASSFNRLRTRVAELRKGRRFTSPVCPLCGYSEPAGGAENDRSAADSVIVDSTKSIARTVAKIVAPLWPSRDVPSYWAICRYERL
ncbi:MAG: class I SAM-dependent methyltransferase [Gemmatimonadaceae bacterium]